MSTVFQFLAKGGPVMIPIVGLSIATVASALERAIFWSRLLRAEKRIVHDVLEAAHYNLDTAAEIAFKAQDQPIGRFLFSALRLQDPTPETFRLALQTTGEEEFIEMRRGNRLLETVVAVAPLLGLLGTVTGLIVTFVNLKIGGGGSSVDTSKAAEGIGEALITTAGGMIVAIVALLILRVSTTFQGKQVEYFSKVAGKLELIYRHLWYERSQIPEESRSQFANREF
ncbi:MAG: MotA/TolQ/ExbB proton channel family protein [Oscillatoriales cyanobacterium C42_A2020_001]|nr:MotA/TolQ/ExbB proton channel family protein [Leptolyngbyaceae cyanobacterium C42_A2020_001]